MNIIAKEYDWTAIIVSKQDKSISAQAKSELLVEIFKKNKRKAVFRKFIPSYTLFEDIHRTTHFWVLWFPVELEDYWAAE